MDGQLKQQFENCLDSDKTLSFSFNGNFLAAAGSYDEIIRIWIVNKYNSNLNASKQKRNLFLQDIMVMESKFEIFIQLL
ncbi:unnamed protein product [Paramecium sonneborni]|uniref:Uncharacterized protein n=1 Tax=Paramecium sonneborni TaxID=65129 RepID=A0A8S1JUX4_9CILI|nr:unnamed protein product [Paramecium sonneborni]